MLFLARFEIKLDINLPLSNNSMINWFVWEKMDVGVDSRPFRLVWEKNEEAKYTCNLLNSHKFHIVQLSFTWLWKRQEESTEGFTSGWLLLIILRYTLLVCIPAVLMAGGFSLSVFNCHLFSPKKKWNKRKADSVSPSLPLFLSLSLSLGVFLFNVSKNGQFHR